MPNPKPISPQKSRALSVARRKLERTATVAHNRMVFCRMSPMAVRRKPRWTKSDNNACAPASAHTPVIHLRPASIERPTGKLYCYARSFYGYGGNQPSDIRSQCSGLFQSKQEFPHKAENVLIGVV